MDIFLREEMLIGSEKLKSLSQKKVAVFGIGGVGGYVCEILGRSGVGTIALIDNDVVSTSNINRQILALHTTIGQSKVEVMEDRLKDINPKINVRNFQMFYDKKSEDEIDLTKFDYVVDAIDTVSSKLLLIKNCQEKNIKIISCMGTGNKIKGDFKIDDIKNTSVCPLCKVMRKELKNLGIESLKVLYSTDVPIKPNIDIVENGRHIPGSIAFSPALAGILIAREVILDLIGESI